MTNQPSGQVGELIDGIYVFPASTAGTFEYLPPPAVLAGPDGRPMVSVITAGEASFLMLTTCLAAAGPQLDAVTATLAGRDRRPVATVSLTQVGIAEVAAELIVDGEVLAHSSTSGTVGWQAAWSVQLQADAAAAVSAGLSGERGRAAVRYVVTLQRPTPPAVVTTSSRTETTTSSTVSSGSDSSGSSRTVVITTSDTNESQDPPFAASADEAEPPQTRQANGDGSTRHCEPGGRASTDTTSAAVQIDQQIDAADWT